MAKTTKPKKESIKASVINDSGALVQKKAFELYVKRGKRAGHEIDDWLEAERLVKQRSISR